MLVIEVIKKNIRPPNRIPPKWDLKLSYEIIRTIALRQVFLVKIINDGIYDIKKRLFRRKDSSFDHK